MINFLYTLSEITPLMTKNRFLVRTLLIAFSLSVAPLTASACKDVGGVPAASSRARSAFHPAVDALASHARKSLTQATKILAWETHLSDEEKPQKPSDRRYFNEEIERLKSLRETLLLRFAQYKTIENNQLIAESVSRPLVTATDALNSQAENFAYLYNLTVIREVCDHTTCHACEIHIVKTKCPSCTGDQTHYCATMCPNSPWLELTSLALGSWLWTMCGYSLIAGVGV